MSFLPKYFDVITPRKLRPELRDRIVARLQAERLAEFQLACETRNAAELVYLAAWALSDMKVREVGGNNKGVLVGLIQAVIGYFAPKGDGQPWCMSYVQLCVAFAEHYAGYVSALHASESCALVRQGTPADRKVSVAQSKRGDIWVWKYPSGTGHTGIFSHWKVDGSVAFLFEGNTEKGLVGGTVQREGGGVYETVRAVRIVGMTLAAVIRPFLTPPLPRSAEPEAPEAPPKAEVLPPVVSMSLPWDGKHPDSANWTAYVTAALSQSTLPNLVPNDIIKYCVNYAELSREKRIEFWANLLSKMSEYESAFKPQMTYTEGFSDAKGKSVVSRGLLQLSIESANGYGCGLSSADELHDPKTNLWCAIKIMEKWVAADKVLSGRGAKGSWLGVGRYWSVGRELSGSKPRAAFTGIIRHLQSLRL